MESLEPKNKLTLGNVDVSYIDSELKKMSLIVNIKCRQEEFNPTEVNSRVNHSVKQATKYLVTEGFLKDTSGWKVEINVIGYNEDNNDTYDAG